jgi:hypothetical protein
MSKHIKVGHGGTRKYGRNKVKCERYRREHRREKNKLRRLQKAFRNNQSNKHLTEIIKRLELSL